MFNGWKQEAKRPCYKVSYTETFERRKPSQKWERKATKSRTINFLLTSFAWSLLESICLWFFHTDLAPSWLGLYENLRQMLSHTDFVLA